VTDVTVTPAVEVREEVSLGQVVSLADTKSFTDKVPLARRQELAKSINLRDTQTVIGFGVESQKQVTTLSSQMLQGVRTKDTGPVSSSMVEMVSTMRGLDFGSIKPGQKVGFFQKLLGKASALTTFLQKYETVESHIATVQNKLDTDRRGLLKDIVMLDKLYDATLNSLFSLEEYTAAAEYVLEQTNTIDIPALEVKSKETGDMLDAQNLRDLLNARDTLERKIHDMKLTRQVIIQGLPTIRIVQDNDKGLAEKIQSQILNTIPLWQQQLAVAVTMWRAQEAAKDSKKASDFTNELLVSGAEQLQQGTKAIRTEIERGVFDIEAIEKSNNLLIQTITETIDIAEQGKAARKDAETRLVKAEEDLKSALVNASARQAALK
jgi:uncharacterized protein YaaN involved in tellurite resistance